MFSLDGPDSCCWISFPCSSFERGGARRHQVSQSSCQGSLYLQIYNPHWDERAQVSLESGQGLSFISVDFGVLCFNGGICDTWGTLGLFKFLLWVALCFRGHFATLFLLLLGRARWCVSTQRTWFAMMFDTWMIATIWTRFTDMKFLLMSATARWASL